MGQPSKAIFMTLMGFLGRGLLGTIQTALTSPTPDGVQATHTVCLSKKHAALVVGGPHQSPLDILRLILNSMKGTTLTAWLATKNV